MSLGGTGDPVESCATTNDPLHKAIWPSTAAGITSVVAAGNDEWDFDYAPEPDTPAAYPEVLTVTAMADSDGQPGRPGAVVPACDGDEPDDGVASFSNWAGTSAGAAHTIAGPGVCVRSTGSAAATRSARARAWPRPTSPARWRSASTRGRARPVRGPHAGPDRREDARGRRRSHCRRPGYGFAGDLASPRPGRVYGPLVGRARRPRT